MQASDNAYAVIIAGGSGTRLWPKSRKKQPKHFLNLFDKGSMIQLTLKRISTLIPENRIFIITHKDHVNLLKKQLPEFPLSNIIAEPEAKGTAMAMGVATAYIHRKNPKAVIFNLWADQMFEEVEKFQNCVLTSLTAAQSGDYIVTVGIRPTFPHTGLGYVRIGQQIEIPKKSWLRGSYIFQGRGFKEKPNLVTAQSFIASKEYLWNTGLYCWSIKTILTAFQKYSPKISKALQDIIQKDGSITPDFLENLYKLVGNPNSIDYEVSEKAKNIVVVPGNFDWSDVGDWKVVYDIQQKDSSKNIFTGAKDQFINIDSKNCLVEANGRLIATVGLEDIVIIDTDDVLLVCSKAKAQEVKKVVEALKTQKKDKFL